MKFSVLEEEGLQPFSESHESEAWTFLCFREGEGWLVIFGAQPHTHLEVLRDFCTLEDGVLRNRNVIGGGRCENGQVTSWNSRTFGEIRDDVLRRAIEEKIITISDEAIGEVGAPIDFESWRETRWAVSVDLQRLFERIDALDDEVGLPGCCAILKRWYGMRDRLARFIEQSVDAFNPRHLITRSPIRCLPEDERQRMGEDLDVKYSAALTIPKKREILRRVFRALEDSIDNFVADPTQATAQGIRKWVCALDSSVQSFPHDVHLP